MSKNKKESQEKVEDVQQVEQQKEAVAIEDVKITTVNYDLVDSSESKLKRRTNRVKMIKRAIWLTILVLIMTILVVSIVKSFRPDRTTSDSTIPEELYPEGDYNNYLRAKATGCLLYTSDAADDLLCVDLGGRRIIKKKKKQTLNN